MNRVGLISAGYGIRLAKMVFRSSRGRAARATTVLEVKPAGAAAITAPLPTSGRIRRRADFPRAFLVPLAGSLLSLFMLAGQGHYLPQTSPIRLTSQASRMRASAASQRRDRKNSADAQGHKRRWLPAGTGIARRIPSVLDARLPSLTSAWSAIQLRSPPSSAL
jgi:hypothetical protein